MSLTRCLAWDSKKTLRPSTSSLNNRIRVIYLFVINRRERIEDHVQCDIPAVGAIDRAEVHLIRPVLKFITVFSLTCLRKERIRPI